MGSHFCRRAAANALAGGPLQLPAMSIATVEEIIAEIRAGRMVILVDEEDRENEGDLILAADFVTPEAINFMARFGRGLICLTLTAERCRQLDLPLMVTRNGTPHGTNFTVSIEAPRASPPASRPPTVRAPCKSPWPAVPAPTIWSSPATSSR